VKIGKLPPDALAHLLSRLAAPRDPRVVMGAALGEDAAALDMAGGPGLLVAAADPITFPTDRPGWYAVQINANDVAAMGAVPRWFLATILLPPSATLDLAETLMAQISDACAALGVSVVGGHTEVTLGLTRPLICGCMLGEVAPDRLVGSGGAQPGDTVLLLGGVGVEGTALLAQEAALALAAAGLTDQELRRAAGFLADPGISVVAAAQAVCAVSRPHALHDVTEGGVATGLRELASSSGVGLLVHAAALPIAPQTLRICATLGLHPWGLLGSGALLAAIAPHDAPAVLAQAQRQGIACAAIGAVTPADHGLVVRAADGTNAPLPTFERDEVARYLE